MNNNDFVGFGGLIGMALAVIFGGALVAEKVDSNRKFRNISRKIDMTVNDLENDSVVDIKDGVVAAAVNRVVERNVGPRINSISNDILYNARSQIHNEVKKVVDEQVGQVKQRVSDKLSDELMRMDISDIKRSCRDDVEEKLMEKIDDKLDDIADDLVDGTTSKSKFYIVRR